MKTKLLLFILLLGPITSQATQISGILGFLDIVGTVTLNNNNPALATEVISWDGVRFDTSPTYDFRGLRISTSDLTAPWIFDPSTPTMPFLQIGGFTFNLESVFNFARFNDPVGTSMKATGDVTHLWFETTPLANCFFAAIQDTSHKNVKFFLEISATGRSNPDSGATVGLFGFALGCVELLRRRFSTKG